ncbi:uncharacterized protein [Miscanthus floridulus]|uniref:uncharacterized protein n=1 Tax=Miscanthus floridulus TaxID=154761 RepID=UPI00345AAD0A
MDNSDEERQNSSEMSFNDVVTVDMAAGTEGSAHDMRVKRKAEAGASFPHPPSDRYYLVDSGYTLRPGYLTPYPNKRYWVKKFQTRGATDAQEVFNRHHSKLRNSIPKITGASAVYDADVLA